MAAPQEGPRRLLDFTINVQSLVVSLIGSLIVATAATVGIYFSVIKDVQALQLKGDEYAKRFERIDRDMSDQRAETKEQLRVIGQNVEKIRDYLLDNAAGQRPEIKRWTR